MANKSHNGVIEITQQEKSKILDGMYIMNSSTNDVGTLVSKPFRVCGMLYMSMPIVIGMLMAAPTMKNTIFF